MAKYETHLGFTALLRALGLLFLVAASCSYCCCCAGAGAGALAGAGAVALFHPAQLAPRRRTRSPKP